MYAAVIVESRPLPNLREIIEGHMNQLPKGWDLVVWHSLSNKAAMMKACEGFKSVRFVGLLVNKMSIRQYNALLTSVNFWEIVSAYQRVLIFQADSMLLRKGVEDFLTWDFVGAPWEWQEHGGNGGLSIRNPLTMKRVIENIKYNGDNEDTFFSNVLHTHPHLGRLAPMGVCKKFSCETIFNLGTMGYHAIEKYFTPDQVNQIKNQYTTMKTLESKYEELCATRSDINEHLPVLREYASKCKHITEMGVRGVVSTYAFLMGRPDIVIGYDIELQKEKIDEFSAIADKEGLKYLFIESDVLKADIERTEFLFIDTFHTATQLKKELALHADKVSKYIGFHDTHTFWENGEQTYDSVADKGTNCGMGLKYALEPFLAYHPEWKVVYRTDKNNGLTIIERVK